MNNAKYTPDQKRRAIEEIYRRLTEFESTLRLIRQFDICEQDLENYLRPRRMANDPALSTSLAYDPYTGQPISGWPHVKQRVKSMSGWTIDEPDREDSTSTFAPYIPMSIVPDDSSLEQAAREYKELLARAHKASVAHYLQKQDKDSALKNGYMDWA